MSRRGPIIYLSTYLIHLDSPLSAGYSTHTARHYIGRAVDLTARLSLHKHGGGCRFLQVANERAIPWRLARAWQGDCERRLKNRHNAPALCPVCTPAPQPVRYAPELPIPVPSPA